MKIFRELFKIEKQYLDGKKGVKTGRQKEVMQNRLQSPWGARLPGGVW